MEDIHYMSGEDVDPILLVELLDEHDADIIAQLNERDLETAAAILSQFPLDRAVEIFDRPELARAGELILELPEELGGRVLKGMSADRAADVLRQLDGPDRTKPSGSRRFRDRAIAETAACLPGRHRGQYHDDRVRQRAFDLHGRGNA